MGYSCRMWLMERSSSRERLHALVAQNVQEAISDAVATRREGQR
jgi:hypothetical protein